MTTQSDNMTLSPEVKDALRLSEEAHHMAVVYALRASVLTNWQRYSDFVSLGVAPALILVLTVRDSEALRTTFFALSAACSLGAWTWAVFGRVFRWDRQLEVSNKVAIVARRLSNDFHETAQKLISAKSTDDCAPLVAQLSQLKSEHDRLFEEVHGAQVTYTDEMDLVAQQQTLRLRGGVCAQCRSTWRSTTPICVGVKDAKHFIKKNRKKMAAGESCPRCGQSVETTTK